MEILPSGKTGADIFDNRTTNPNKVLDRLSMRIVAQSLRKFYEVVRGWCYSGDEASATAIDEDLSVITSSNINDYESTFTQGLNTLIAFNNTLEVDGSSTANAIVLVPKKISSDVSPNSTDYSTNCPLPLKYQDELEFTFRAIDNNTGPVSISIPSLNGLSGDIDLVDENGEDLVGGEIVGNRYIKIKLKTISSVKKAILLNRDKFPKENAIINGDFNIWQRGTSFTSIADAAYSADRFQYAKSGSMVHDITRSTDVPSFAQAGRIFNYSAKIDCQTIDSSITSTKYCAFNQVIEGYNWIALAQKPTTLSFWVKSTKTGTFCVALRNTGADRSCVMEFIVNASATWEKKVINFPASPSAGNWNYTNGIGATLSFVLAAGSAIQITPNSWQSANAIATSNQVNACDSASNDFYLTGVQLEEGVVATPFKSRTFQEELALCQRYYEKSYDYAVAPGTIIGNGKITARTVSGSVDSNVVLCTTKRTAPTITTYNPVTGTAGQIRNESAGTNLTVGAEEVSDHGFGVNTASGVSNADRISYHFTANAEL